MPPANALLRGPSTGFPVGYTPVTTPDARRDGPPDSGMEFGVVRQLAGTTLTETSELETAWVLLRGAAELEFGGTCATVRRGNIFASTPDCAGC